MFENRLLVPLIDGAIALGLAEKTARNMLVAGKFPVKTVVIGRKRLVVVADLIRYVDELTSGVVASEPIPAPKVKTPPVPGRRPGRPTKAEQLARQQLAGGAK